MAAGPKNLTRAQAAEAIGLRETTLRHWSWRARKGLRLPDGAAELLDAEFRVGRSIRYDAEAVERWRRARSLARSARRAGGESAVLREQAQDLAKGLQGADRHDLARIVTAVSEALQ